MTAVPTILATSGGFVADGRYGLAVGPLLSYALELTGARRPRLCLLHTATGDNPAHYALTYSAVAAHSRALALSGRDDVVLSHLALFPMPTVRDVRSHLLDQDLVWVGGGSVVNLLAVWRAHGVDQALREAWLDGVVLGGVSAGSICWHVGGTTDSFGPDLRPVTNGLGLLPYSNGVHYDSEEQRRPLFQELVAGGTLPAGYATDDGVGLHYSGLDLVEAVSDRPAVAAYHVTATADGHAVEERIEARLLA